MPGSIHPVFLDANVLKFGSTSTVLRPKPPIEIEWGNLVLKDVVVHEFVDQRWSDKLKGNGKTEADLLPAIAELAKKGAISLLMSGEVDMEWWGLKGSAGRRTMMGGAPITRVDPPMKYSRTVVGGSRSPREYRDVARGIGRALRRSAP